MKDLDLSSFFKNDFHYTAEKGLPSAPGDYYAIPAVRPEGELEMIRIFDIDIKDYVTAGYYMVLFKKQFEVGDKLRLVSMIGSNGVSYGPIQIETLIAVYEKLDELYANGKTPDPKAMEGLDASLAVLRGMKFYRIPDFKVRLMQ
jgi:hypothetical protein